MGMAGTVTNLFEYDGRKKKLMQGKETKGRDPRASYSIVLLNALVPSDICVELKVLSNKSALPTQMQALLVSRFRRSQGDMRLRFLYLPESDNSSIYRE